MKKLLIILMALILALSTLTACVVEPNNPNEGGPEQSGPEQGGPEQGGPEQGGPQTPTTTYYKVTFKQEGKEDFVIEVESGKGVAEADIPALEQKEGYTVAWETVDLSNITADVTVNATYTAIEYVITLVYPSALPEEFKEITEIKLKYGETYELPQRSGDPISGGYEITAWKIEDGTVMPFTGVYNLTKSITLSATVNYWTGIA